MINNVMNRARVVDMGHMTRSDVDKLRSGDYSYDFRSWIRGGGKPEDTAGLFSAGGFGTDRRSLSTQTPGILLPSVVSQDAWRRMTGSSSMRTVATVKENLGGADVGFAFVDDSANSGDIRPEGTATTEAEMTVSLKVLKSYMFDSKIVRASFQLLADMGDAMAQQMIVETLADRAAAALNQYATIGAGANEPQGLFTAAPVGVTASSATAITYDELVRLIESVPDQYAFGRNGTGSNARFMMSGSTFAHVCRLKDSAGQTLWRQDPYGGTLGLICGRQVVVNPDAPAIAAGSKPVVYGLLSAYVISDINAAVVSYYERYAEYLQAGFRAYSRHACQLVDSNAVKALQMAAA